MCRGHQTLSRRVRGPEQLNQLGTWFDIPNRSGQSTANEIHCPGRTDRGSDCCATDRYELRPEPARDAIVGYQACLKFRRREIANLHLETERLARQSRRHTTRTPAA